MITNKNWICLICHRSGEEAEMSEAQQAHRNKLLADEHWNKVQAERNPGFQGPATHCIGNIVVSNAETRNRGRKPEIAELPFGDDPIVVK